MSVYNVRILDYLEGSQIRVYSAPMGVPKDERSEFNLLQDELNRTLTEIGFKDSETKVKLVKDFNKGVKDKERSLYVSKNRTINSIYEIARSNEWEYFLTLTFNPDKVDSFNYDEVSKKLSKWLNNFKNRFAPDLKYLVVPELHKSGRFHFHALLSNIGNAELVDSGKKDSSGNVIYNLGNYNLGFSTVTKIKDMKRCSSYIGKYITKDLCAVSENKKRYWSSKNLDRPKVTELLLTPDEIEDMFLTFNRNIVFEKTVECSDYNCVTHYYEINF